MNVLVNPKNEQEEKVLLAFLNSLNYKYQADADSLFKADTSFIDQYNAEINLADQEIETGNFMNQEEVNELFWNRRNSTR